VEVFKDRQAKLTFLSFLSALVVVSTTFTGMSVYAVAAKDDGQMITTTNPAGTTMDSSNNNVTTTQPLSQSDTSSNVSNMATADQNTNKSRVSLNELFNGLVVCNLGTASIDRNKTQTVAADNSSLVTPKVTIKILNESELASLRSNQTNTLSNSNNSTSAVQCKVLGEGESSNNSILIHRFGMSNETTMSSTPSINNNSNAANAEKKIAVIEGRDFAPEQVVLIFSHNALIAIDDVSSNGQFEARVPTSSLGNEVKFVESGTNRTATFQFNGNDLISSTPGQIVSESASTTNQNMTMSTMASENATSNAGTITNKDNNSTNNGNSTSMQ
jgi:hypothetical protein